MIHRFNIKDLNHIKNLNFLFLFFIALLLVIHGDIETNPGPKSENSKYFHAVTGMLAVFLHNSLY